jgi:ubiquinone/menaquinone biosynthesis C-methylase UbiE
MKQISGVSLSDVQAVYSGPEGDLWELIMGQQVHIGGFQSSTDLASKAGIPAGGAGVDLCCCNGAGMRFLLRFREVAHMTGVDATPKVLEQARQRCAAEGFGDRATFVQAEVTDTGLPGAQFDFVWGEDAWCYVADKPRLVAEALRLVKPGGLVAFTDWIEGDAGLDAAEAERWMRFMKFPSVESRAGYAALLESQGCQVLAASDTGRFAPYVDLYLNMVGMQLTSDVLRLIAYDAAMLQAIAGEMQFMSELAHKGKIAQGLFIAKK